MDTQLVTLTDAAAKRIRALIDEDGNQNLKLRMFIQGGGCSGFEYGFTFDEVVNEDDTEVTHGDVTLLIDAISGQYLAGASLDYEEKLEGARFIVKNPNASASCGCGSSFTV